jgi:hypothetical protein
MNEDTIGTTQHIMMLEANHDGFPKGNIKLHGYFGFSHKKPWLHDDKRYVRKSSSMTLNEALCGRKPDLFIYLYKLWQVYIVFFIWKLQVTLFHCSNKCHNHILYALIYIEWALFYLNFGKLVDHFVNTKIWYRKESDLCAQIGKKIRPEEGKLSPERFGKEARGRQFASVRKGNCLRWFCGIAWWRGPSGRDEWMDKQSHLEIN